MYVMFTLQAMLAHNDATKRVELVVDREFQVCLQCDARYVDRS